MAEKKPARTFSISNYPILSHTITALLFGGALVTWWFYGDPLGVSYDPALLFRLLLDILLALSLSYVNLRLGEGRFSMASVINFSAMLTLPPAYMPAIALVLTFIYFRKKPLSEYHLAVHAFSVFLWVYLLSGYTFRLVAPGSDFQKATPEMLVGAVLAFIIWTLVNYLLQMLNRIQYRSLDIGRFLYVMQRDIPREAIIIPVGLLHSLIIMRDDMLLITIWSIFLAASGGFVFRLYQLQQQASEQNTQLLKQKSELEQVTRREHATGVFLAQSSGRLSSIALEQSESINRQFNELNEVSFVIDKLSNSAQEVADIAYRVAQSAEQSLDSAQNGQEFLTTSLEALADLQIGMEGLVDQTTEMANQSREIDQLVEVIQEIAEETHLLAVNATIEASGAGEYGQRFAVVASEVNQLANRSRQSSQQVQKVVNRMRDAVDTVLQQIELSRDQSRRTGQSMYDAVNRTNQIIQATKRTTDLAQRISTSTEDQRSNMHHAASAIEMLLQMSEGAVRLSEKSRETAAQLDRLSETLRHEQSRLIATVAKTPAPNNGSVKTSPKL